ncbi:MAG: hypothetical protein J3R72DRAFT_450851 [Linnemannia gamsii]|nr:MAG: hypothetical protein J3R72DRAFT_450851 [Linnemannia gamsii]
MLCPCKLGFFFFSLFSLLLCYYFHSLARHSPLLHTHLHVQLHTHTHSLFRCLSISFQLCRHLFCRAHSSSFAIITFSLRQKKKLTLTHISLTLLSFTVRSLSLCLLLGSPLVGRVLSFSNTNKSLTSRNFPIPP